MRAVLRLYEPHSRMWRTHPVWRMVDNRHQIGRHRVCGGQSLIRVADAETAISRELTSLASLFRTREHAQPYPLGPRSRRDTSECERAREPRGFVSFVHRVSETRRGACRRERACHLYGRCPPYTCHGPITVHHGTWPDARLSDPKARHCSPFLHFADATLDSSELLKASAAQVSSSALEERLDPPAAHSWSHHVLHRARAKLSN